MNPASFNYAEKDYRQKKKQSFQTAEAAIPKDLPFFLKEKMLESSLIPAPYGADDRI